MDEKVSEFDGVLCNIQKSETMQNMFRHIGAVPLSNKPFHENGANNHNLTTCEFIDVKNTSWLVAVKCLRWDVVRNINTDNWNREMMHDVHKRNFDNQ